MNHPSAHSFLRTALLAALTAATLLAGESNSLLPEYQPGPQVSGVIRTWGSPYMGGSCCGAGRRVFSAITPGSHLKTT
jgi:hypothetical protein